MNFSAVAVFFTLYLQFHVAEQWFWCRWWLPRGALRVPSGSPPSWARRRWFCFPDRLLGPGQNQHCTRFCATLWMRCWRFGFIATDLTKCFENRWGQPTISGQHLLHHTAIYLLSTEMGCHAEIYFTSLCWSYQNCHSWQSPVTAALPLPTGSLKRCCMISDKLHYRLCRGLILFFELPDISFSAEASAQQSHSLTSGNFVSSLICFQ